MPALTYQRLGLSVEWATPQRFFDALDHEFGFTLDVCAVPENAKCSRFYSPEEDGLTQPWMGVCWMNPPYGRVIAKWMRKAWESAQAGATVVCLVPSRSDTAWWHDYAMHGEIRYIRGRMRFSGIGRAPFPSVLVIFRPPRADVQDALGFDDFPHSAKEAV